MHTKKLVFACKNVRTNFVLRLASIFWGTFRCCFENFLLSPSKNATQKNSVSGKLYDLHFSKQKFFCFVYDDTPNFMPKQKND